MATNVRFNNYLEGLTKKQRLMACEAIEQYLVGETENVEQILRGIDVYKANRDLCNKDEEYFILMCLDVKHKLLKKVEISHGLLTACFVDVRVLMREALLSNAVNIVVVHNHPSGIVTPSIDDSQLTRKIQDACNIMDIHLIDHVIVGGNDYFSFREDGRL